MDKIGIRKVSVLQGMAKDIAEEHGLEPNDLVIVTVSLEKVMGDPVSYLLSQIEEDDIQGFGELFVENINKELGIEEEYRHSTGSAIDG